MRPLNSWELVQDGVWDGEFVRYPFFSFLMLYVVCYDMYILG
jgi:hypothetical protein